MTEPGEGLDPEDAERLVELIGQVMATALRTEDPAAVQLEVRRLLPEIAPKRVAAAAGEASLRSLESSLARVIWNASPLPSNGYRARPLPEPDRNEACPCGAAAKYKRCCAPFAHQFPRISPEAAWQALSAQVAGKEAERLLAINGLPPEAIAPLARRVHERGRSQRAQRLLEGHLSAERRIDSRHAEALLLAIELDADRRGSEAAMERALARAVSLPPELQAAVFRRLVPFALDAGDADLARELFERARDGEPEHPDLAALDVMLALVAGDLERARSRAAFWLAWLKRRGLAEEMTEAVELLETTIRDAEAARAELDQRADLEMPPFLVDLREIVSGAAERPVQPCDVGMAAGSAVFGGHSPEVRKAEAAWRKAWPGGKPDLVSLDAAFDPLLFQDADRWLAVLRRHPAAFDSLSILDDLVLLVAPLAGRLFPTLSAAVCEPLLGRALATIRASLAGREDGRLEWAFLQNRPALRLLTQEALRLDNAGRAGDAAALFEWMLRLNPNDNHGHREWLVNHSLRTAADARALEVADAYAGDVLVPTRFGRGLALWRLGRRDEAEAALRSAAAECPRVVRALLADEVAHPRATRTVSRPAGRKRRGCIGRTCSTPGGRRPTLWRSSARFRCRRPVLAPGKRGPRVRRPS